MKGPRLSFLLPRCSLSYPKIVQGERSAKRKTRFLICTSEPQPILFKDSANRAQYKMKGPRLSFLLPRCSLSYPKIVQGERSAKRKTRFLICTSEPQPILFKDSANRAQYKMKGPRLSFLLPRCSLSYPKIVQGERSAKRKTRFLICTSEPQPILSKDSAR